jgi:hypothetical protein
MKADAKVVTIGSTLWRLDRWTTSRPAWEPFTIVGETRVSWVMDRDAGKVEKGTLRQTAAAARSNYARPWFTPERMAEMRWAGTNGSAIRTAVEGAIDQGRADALAEIAKVLHVTMRQADPIDGALTYEAPDHAR